MKSEVKSCKLSARQWKVALAVAVDCLWSVWKEDQGNLNVDYILDDSKKLLLILLDVSMALYLC